MTAKAVAYAENDLGVHLIFEQTVQHTVTLDTLLADLDKAQDDKRRLLEEIADAEADLASDERGKHADMSAAAFDQHFKAAKRKDPDLRILRGSLDERLGEIQGLEFDIDLCKTRIKVGVARMEQLGGYLHYLAAVKAEAANKTNKTGTSS